MKPLHLSIRSRAVALALLAIALVPGVARADSLSFGQITSDFNVVTLGNTSTGDNGNFTASNGQAQGCVAAAGNVNISSYALGTSVTSGCAAGGTNVAPVVAGGSVSASNGSIAGNASGQPPIIYGTTDSISGLGISGTPVQRANAVDWAATRSAMTRSRPRWPTSPRTAPAPSPSTPSP